VGEICSKEINSKKYYRVKKHINMGKKATSSDGKMEQMLERRIKKLENEVSELKEKLAQSAIEHKTIIVDDTVSFQEVKKRVLEFLKNHPDRDYDSFALMEELHLDPLEIKKVLLELESEGLVK